MQFCTPQAICCHCAVNNKLDAMLPWLQEPSNGRKLHVLLQQHGAAPEVEQTQELLAELFLATPGQMHLD